MEVCDSKAIWMHLVLTQTPELLDLLENQSHLRGSASWQAYRLHFGESTTSGKNVTCPYTPVSAKSIRVATAWKTVFDNLYEWKIILKKFRITTVRNSLVSLWKELKDLMILHLLSVIGLDEDSFLYVHCTQSLAGGNFGKICQVLVKTLCGTWQTNAYVSADYLKPKDCAPPHILPIGGGDKIVFPNNSRAIIAKRANMVPPQCMLFCVRGNSHNHYMIFTSLPLSDLLDTQNEVAAMSHPLVVDAMSYKLNVPPPSPYYFKISVVGVVLVKHGMWRICEIESLLAHIHYEGTWAFKNIPKFFKTRIQLNSPFSPPPYTYQQCSKCTHCTKYEGSNYCPRCADCECHVDSLYSGHDYIVKLTKDRQNIEKVFGWNHDGRIT